MCGIFGKINLERSQIDLSDLEVISNSMAYRGPDDEGKVFGAHWSIGMRRLSIIDLETGHQPISNSDNSIHLVANGEIYNYRELTDDLKKIGYTFKTKSDVEVILHLYQEYGENAVNYLNGMFAFAIFDEKENKLVIARDRLGIKPLYFSEKKGNFYFSSELTGLAKTLNRTISESSVISYLGYSYVKAPHTIFQDVNKLMPGEIISISGKKRLSRIYWKKNKEIDNGISISDAVNMLDKQLNESIDMQLVSDVPIGVFLSGGVDSSAVAEYANKNTKSKINTFTLDFKNKQSQDSLYASIMSSKLDTNHVVIEVSNEEQIEQLEEIISFLDEPIADSAIVPTFIISKEAKKRGIKVLLSGAGGDEIFGGYSRYKKKDFLSAAWFASLPKPLRKISTSILAIINSSYKYRLKNPAINFLVSISGINLSFLENILLNKNHFKELLISIEKDYEQAESEDPYDLLSIDLDDYLPNNILMLTDKATMAASVEGRVPLLDHKLVDLAFRFPQKVNLHKGESKGLFKKTLEGRLPRNLLDRKKDGFNAPVNVWFNEKPELLRSEIKNNFSPLLSKLICKKTILEYIDTSHLRKNIGPSIYSIYVLNKWLNFHFQEKR